MIAIAVFAAAVLVCAAVLFHDRSTDALLRDRRFHRVVVELQSGDTFQGVLAACDRQTLVLRNVKALTSATAQPTPVDGELLVPRADVKFLQRP